MSLGSLKKQFDNCDKQSEYQAKTVQKIHS